MKCSKCDGTGSIIKFGESVENLDQVEIIDSCPICRGLGEIFPTPGPWKIYTVDSVNGDRFDEIRTEDGIFIASTDSYSNDNPNSVLLSAAPELKESLEKMVEIFDKLCATGDFSLLSGEFEFAKAKALLNRMNEDLR